MKKRNRLWGGFTLIEMLVVIAVIGLIVSISLPMISHVFGDADSRADKRGAQIICSMAAAAQSAGDTTIASALNAKAAADLVIAGVYGQGEFSDTIFRVPNMTVDERNRALKHLTFSKGVLIYTPQP
jgi:prepilin-type N-terminal cleavage/methylation domain-containing protein